MLVKDYGSIRLSDTRHKYSSAMAEYLDVKGLDFADQDTGDVESPVGFVARHGRRLVVTDDRGFVDCVTYMSADDAKAVFDAADGVYCAWSDEDATEEGPDERVIEAHKLYFQYVVECASEGLEAFSMIEWRIRNRPKGPLG